MATLDKLGRQTRPGRSTVGKPPATPSTSQQTTASTTASDGYAKLLEDFDLNYAFGPSNGISRLERWERAKKLGLNPPEEIKVILEKHTDPEYTESLWSRHLCGIK